MVSILHVAQPTGDGVGRAVLGLARAQRADGLDVTVASPPGPLPDRLTAAGLRWERWDCVRRPGPGLRGERQALAAIVGACRPDLVHLHSSKAGLVGRLVLRRRVRTVFQPHAWSFLAAAGGMRHAALRWERFATRWTDLTLFCSRQEQSDGARHGIAGAGRVVLNGVNLADLAPVTPSERQAARQALGIAQGAFVAVVVGRRSPQKGQDLALRAWPSVRAEFRSAVLVLMGEGYADDFDAAAGVLTRAARDDARPAFAVADVVLAPSRWEGLSLSLLEGMACARPTVATEAAGSREALTGGPLPSAGAVVPIDDAAAVAAAVLRRFRDPALAGREGAAARRRVEATFDEGATTRSVLDTYEFLLGPLPRPPFSPASRPVPLPGFHPASPPGARLVVSPGSRLVVSPGSHPAAPRGDAFSHQVLER